MDLLAIILSGSLAAIVVWLVQGWSHKARRLPPGPFRWPLIGNLFQILRADAKYTHVAYTKLAKVYGKIVWQRVGVVDFVTLNGYEEIKAVSTSEDWLIRLVSRTTMERTFEKPIGIIFADLHTWKTTRRFTERHLHDFGFGKNETTEKLVRRELSDLYTQLDNIIQDGGIINEAHKLFKIPMVNIVWSLISGRRFNHDDQRIIKLVDFIADYTKSLMSGGLGSMYPFLVDWAPSLTAHAQQMRANTNIRLHFQDLLKDHRKRDVMENPGCFIDLFLQHVQKSKEDGSEDDIFTDENLISILYDIFWAGTSTSSSVLSFALLWLSLHVHVQDRMREELHILSVSTISLQDMNKLTYTRATILEIHRHSFVSPLVNRQAHKEIQIGDYVIPKGTSVLLNYYSVMMDDQFWKDPKNFRPERFIDPHGNIVNAERITPFGSGKRGCFGKPIGEPSVFLVLTNLIKKYKFQILPSEGPPSTDPVPGILLAPQPFKLIVTPAF